MDPHRGLRCMQRLLYDQASQISGMESPRQIFFASMLEISVWRGTASSSPVLRLKSHPAQQIGVARV